MLHAMVGTYNKWINLVFIVIDPYRCLLESTFIDRYAPGQCDLPQRITAPEGRRPDLLQLAVRGDHHLLQTGISIKRVSADPGHVIRDLYAQQAAAFFEGVAADLRQSRRKIYLLQAAATVKSFPAQIRQILRQCDTFQTSAVFKCLSTDLRNAVRQRYFC